ncbi:unnamed protein product [Darwinula stevensoni]|uniref:C-type lectin domain-containing protein n=1 Tax=Darwinula stevensoni TaxID=69355 RepID=A0A7R9FTN0_9CRUS|nr:unnamed protein product [Darwinula stevensoni]CAG0906562.1 unnamed protein product [Darwinula stevensoni]
MPVSCDADGGWVDYAGACYLFPSEMTSAFEAESRCQERGGHLASIHSDQENLFVGRNGEGAPRWIGLQRVDGVWGWSDGSPVDYQNWNENFIFNDTYAIMWIDQWVNDDCSVGRPYICRLHDQVGACPQGWESLSSDCFLLVDAPAAFGTAMEGCRAANPAANLLTFESRDDTNDIVAFVVNSLSGRPVTEYWIGYLRNPSTMAWRWIDGNANQDERWFPGYPEEDASKNCAHLILSSWDDFPPGYTFPFVCKKELAGA